MINSESLRAIAPLGTIDAIVEALIIECVYGGNLDNNLV